MANRCVIVAFFYHEFQKTTARFLSVPVEATAVSFGCLDKKTLFHISASKQTFSMRSRCIVTLWLLGYLYVWLTCDVDWQWQEKRFQRVFWDWATCWSRTYMETKLTLPEEHKAYKGIQWDIVSYAVTHYSTDPVKNNLKTKQVTTRLRLQPFNSKRLIVLRISSAVWLRWVNIQVLLQNS